MSKNVILVLFLTVLVFGLIFQSTVSAYGPRGTTTSTTNPQKISLVTRQYSSVYVEYNYVLTAKVFYTYTNPGKIYDQYWGTVPGAKVSINILNSQGKTVKSFSGVTDNKGYYNAGFRIPYDFVVGKYSVVVTAHKANYSDGENLTLFVQHYLN